MKSGIKLVGLALLLTFSSFLYAGQVNVNTADAKQIATELSGIGTVRAEAIVIYRKENGKFSSWSEDGKPKMSGSYKNGIEVGIWKTYYENGNVESQGAYSKGTPAGKWRRPTRKEESCPCSG
jgi:competence protein ComEA